MAGAFDHKADSATAAPHPTGTLNGTSVLKQVNNVTSNSLGGGFTPVKVVTSGATTAATLKTILSLAGRGVCSFLAVENADTTIRTHRIKITLDGVVVFDATTGANAQTTYAFLAIGSMVNVIASTSSIVTFEPLSFNSSLLVEYACNLSEANGAYIGYRYYAT